MRSWPTSRHNIFPWRASRSIAFCSSNKLPRRSAGQEPAIPLHPEHRCVSLHSADAIRGRRPRCVSPQDRTLLVLDGSGSKDTLAGNWRRAFRRLCEIAGVHGGHPHRFRDTLAVELLLEVVPMERVLVLLGHSSVKITERHYAPWVQARQAQLEADLVRVWQKDPLARAEMLRGHTALHDTSAVQIIATNPRHENSEAPN